MAVWSSLTLFDVARLQSSIGQRPKVENRNFKTHASGYYLGSAPKMKLDAALARIIPQIRRTSAFSENRYPTKNHSV